MKIRKYYLKCVYFLIQLFIYKKYEYNKTSDLENKYFIKLDVL